MRYTVSAAACLCCSLAPVAALSQSGVDKVLPPASQIANPRHSTAVLIDRISFAGNRIFSDTQLLDVVRQYVGQQALAETLQAIRRKLTRYYVDHGYITSAAIVPDQSLDGGELVIRIIEGKLSDVRIFDFEQLRLRPEYISRRIKRGDDEILDIHLLRQRLALLHQSPVIDNLRTELAPGARPGDSILNVEAHEARRRHYGVSVNNHRSPSVGEYRLGAWWEDLNFSRRADRLGLRAGLTAGLKDLAFDYRIPVGFNDGAIKLSASHSESAIIEEPFDQINITSTTDSFALAWEYPLINRPDRTLTNIFSLEKRRSESLLDGEPFQFSPGASNGVARVTVLRWSQNWLHRTRRSVLALQSRFSFGLKGLNATDNSGDAPDGEFIDWFGQLQWIRQIEKTKLILRLESQQSRDPLLAIEKYGLGGAHSVRGYRENLFVRDEGWLGSLEARYAVRPNRLSLAVFLDAGGASSLGPKKNRESLESLGAGLLWTPSKNLDIRGYWGKALTSVDLGPNRHLQDDGVHFSIDYAF